MTDKTIAEMVKELDAKFRGFERDFKLCSTLDEPQKNGYFTKYMYEADLSCWQLEFETKDFNMNIVFQPCRFQTNPLELCVKYAHDYFIVKGLEL